MQVISDAPELGPRERLALYGRAALSDAELLCVLLGTGSAALPVAQVACRLLAQAGSLQGLAKLSLAELEAQSGIGATKACRVLAAVELAVRMQSRPLEPRRAIASSRDVAAALSPRFMDEPREHFLAVALDAKNQPLCQLTIGIGGLTACAVLPADVFRPVIQAAAVSVIFVHNHPSGDPTPSEADVAITERLCRAGELLGIGVLDHVVLGGADYFSFADAGILAGLTGTGRTP